MAFKHIRLIGACLWKIVISRFEGGKLVHNLSPSVDLSADLQSTRSSHLAAHVQYLFTTQIYFPVLPHLYSRISRHRRYPHNHFTFGCLEPNASSPTRTKPPPLANFLLLLCKGLVERFICKMFTDATIFMDLDRCLI